MWCYVSREAWDSAQISGCNHLHRHQFPPGLLWNQILSFSHLLFFFMYLCICVLKSYKDLSSVLVESYTPVVYISPVNSHRSSWESQVESQKPRQCVSNADRKVFANPKSFCDKLIIGWRISGYFALQNIQIVCKVSGWTGKFPDNLKSVQII